MPPPSTSARLALTGRVVTMDEHDTVLARGVVYIADGVIRAVRPGATAPPDGFGDVPRVRSGGTLFPGLIELHNHMPYNVLALWQVPERFTNRDAWREDRVKDYRRLVTGPMSVLADSRAVPAIVRYTETKALVGGTTATQGITLQAAPGIQQLFRGVVRNVEAPGDGLPAAGTRVADVVAADFAQFRAELARQTCKLLPLAEGTDERSRNAFLALKDPDPVSEDWAIGPSLAGIHCVALTAEDFAVLARLGAAMVWSPL